MTKRLAQVIAASISAPTTILSLPNSNDFIGCRCRRRFKRQKLAAAL
jgi:hypothetical protein